MWILILQITVLRVLLHNLLLHTLVFLSIFFWVALSLVIMLLGSCSFSVSLSGGAKLLPSSLSSTAPTFNSVKGSSSVRFSKRNVGCGVVFDASKDANNRPVLDITFEPFEEVKKELLSIPTMPHASLARQKYTDQCEAALNAQIKWASRYCFPCYFLIFFSFLTWTLHLTWIFFLVRIVEVWHY